jgi:uncharacterized RDD family membrane protein YckC
MGQFYRQGELQQLESRIEIVTPENIAFQYRIAGPFRRLPAYLIDLLIRAAVLLSLYLVVFFAFAATGLPGFGIAVFLLAWFALSWFYGGLFETFWNGQTPGKRLMKIRVVSKDGQPIDALQAVLRNVLRAADALPIVPWPWWEAMLDMPVPILPMYQVGLIAPMTNARFQRLGDLAAGTVVVVEEAQRLYGVTRVTEPEAIRLAGLLPANLQVSRSLARALSRYVERRPMFAPKRRAEIARHLGELLASRYGLPPGTSHDLLLCALYYRVFIADRADEEAARSQPPGASPFASRSAVAGQAV